MFVGSGIVSAFAGEPLLLRSGSGGIVLETGNDGKGPRMTVDGDGITVENADAFQVVDPKTGEVYFDGLAPTFNLSQEVRHLQVSELETNQVSIKMTDYCQVWKV